MTSHIDSYIMAQEGLSTLDRPTLDCLQREKLNQLLSRLRAHGATHLPERVTSLADLAELPFTTPQMLAAHPGQYLLLSQGDVARVITDQTSGTTAQAKRVFYTEADVEHTIRFFAAGISEMVAPGDGVLITMPFSGPLGLGDLIRQAVERIGARPLCAGLGRTYTELSALVKNQNPRAYIGFPVPLLSLIRAMRGPQSLERALISGDSCPKGVFRLLSEHLDLYPHYGSREMCLGGAITCAAQLPQKNPDQLGMHLREEHIIAEIIGDDGRPVPDGQEGELVITTIGMEAMPLLRYRTGDRTRFFTTPCPCGSVTRRIAQPLRIGADAALLDRLDDALLALPDVIDLRAERWRNGLNLHALCTKDVHSALRERAEAIAGAPVHVTCDRFTLGATALYPGKRTLITKEV